MLQHPSAFLPGRDPIRRSLIRILGLATVIIGFVSSLAAQTTQTLLPKFPIVAKAVKKHFAGQRDFKSGDLVSVRDVAPLFKKLDKLGWKVADEKQIIGRVLSDNHSLVKQLRTLKGKKFMGQVSKSPAAYDRLDRLSKMPYGKRRVRELIDTPGGHKLIEYMTTTRHGKNLGKLLSKAKNGKNFNQPTGKLYTSKAVLDQLKNSYDAEAKRREGNSRPKK